MADSVRVVIISSRTDALFVEQLERDLRGAGATIWMDHENLPVGHPDWQVAIHRGVENASTVIYVGSPDAAKSRNASAEAQIAVEDGRAIISLWARGKQWTKCAPPALIRSDYLDARGDKYLAARDVLLATLGLRPGATPPIASLPARLGSLGYQEINLNGTPCYIPPLVTVPAGPFLMGSDKAQDPDAYDNETPQHRVEVGAFQITRYPVTVAEYALAVRAGAAPEPSTWAPDQVMVDFGVPDIEISWWSQLHSPNFPVVCVSWHDAVAYATWLATVSGQTGWRLPTEAEWEKAARWDETRQRSRIYPWGDVFDANRCNAARGLINAICAVGRYPASDMERSGVSPYGVAEMAGNVWEWTSSLEKPYPYAQDDGREDPKPFGDRVLRGGACDYGPKLVRAAYRMAYSPSGFGTITGFRIARSDPGA